MLVLHGSWLPTVEGQLARFALWAEFAHGQAGRPRARTTRSRSGTQPHPFAASAAGLRVALIGAGLEDAADEAPAEMLAVRLPSAGGAPLASPELGAGAVDGEVTLATWRAEALTLPAERWVESLLALDAGPLPAGARLGDDLRYWATVARFTLSLARRQRFVPGMVEEERRYFVARWLPLLDDAADAQQQRALVEAMPSAARALTPSESADPPAPGALLDEAVALGLDALARQAFAAERARAKRSAAEKASTKKAAAKKSSRKWERRKPRQAVSAVAGSPGEAWLEALAGDPYLDGDRTEWAALHEQYQSWRTPADEAADTFRLCFRLDPPPVDDLGLPYGDGAWTLHYLMQATDDLSLLLPAADVWRVRGASGRFLNRRFDHPQERLLAGLGRAARLFPPIEGSLRSATPEVCALTTAQAYDFVQEAAPLLAASGFGVLLPGVEQKVGLRLRLGGPAGPKSVTKPTFTKEALVNFDWEVAIGDVTISREEFEALARLKEPLVQVRGRWVEMRPEQVDEALAVLRRHERQAGLSMEEALRLALAPESLNAGLAVEGVSVEGDFRALMESLHGDGRVEMSEPPNLAGELRPYQRTGVSWMWGLNRHGLGACLADDMGLGKTVQTIATLLHERHSNGNGAAPALLICPTSVVGNWQRELTRFAPSLRVLVHHGAERNREGIGEAAAQHDVVLSSYALLHRDASELTAVDWNEVILDEAQNIKNPSTRAAQTARALRARWRLALTGTPVENRLSDLWSIFQFLNPGYLGTETEFRSRFASPIERAHDVAATERLQKLTAPFLLRRLKSDKSVIADLPEKNEMKVFCTLTQEQATLYRAAVAEQMDAIENLAGIQRRGMVLATITKLKQVCDHPALLLHDRSRLEGRSGKLARLGEMLEEVVSIDDRALVFTQYAEMGDLLQSHLSERLGEEVLFLHGGTPAKARDAMVTRFQAEGHGPRVFVLSVKAGGTGLNLTRANHVFHFDRWWNPAVENQATDRAFRIGQRKDVQVHKYVCAGTFEEILDGVIERKLALAEAITGTGESWVTEMSTEDLRNLFTLRGDAVGDG